VKPKRDPIFEKIRKICLSFPDTKLTMTWDSPHFRVGEKIFAGYGDGHAGFKLEAEHAEELIESDPRFERAPYVGRYGWVRMNLRRVRDWKEVRKLIAESYGLIAKKRR
jgi:predicted DNA-binding protein (MmcQ/YjbR family)